MYWDKLKKEIIDTDLYSRSGTEVGVSGGVLDLKEKNGDYYPIKLLDRDIPEISCKASSDKYINYPKLNKFVFGKLPESWLVGEYKKIFIGHIKNKNVRRNASSGGIVTGAQKYLLQKKLVDGVITTKMKKDQPYLSESIIATSTDEILGGAQSKYVISPTNLILRDLPGKYNSLVYTGLPEQIASIRKLQYYKHDSVKNINYVFGLFYGELLSFSALTSFLKTHKVCDLKKIKRLFYRYGEWPGSMRVELKDGRIISVKKFYANYLIPSHITNFSYYQVDYMSELADISVGDGWSPVYEKRGDGWSVIIARSEKGLKLLEDMEKEERVYLQEISFGDLLKMHSHGIDFKKRGAFIRIANRRKKGLPVPEYGYEPVNIPASRFRIEKLLSFLFWLFKQRFFIMILENLPPKFLGWFFVLARDVWKKKTKNAKKGNLTGLRFKIKKMDNI